MCARLSTTVSQLVESWCETRNEVISFNYLWSISNFSYRREKNGEYLRSSLFYPKENQDLKWRLRLYPKGRNEECDGFVSIYLEFDSNDTSTIFAKYSFSLIGEDGRILKTEYIDGHEFADGYCLGFNSFLHTNELFNQRFGYLVNDTLTVRCDVTLVTNSIDVHGQHFSRKVRIPESCLLNDFSSLLETSKLSDVSFIVKGREFKAHKAILAARSPVFAAMFDCDFQEKRTNRVEIDDIDHDVFRELLWYIYTDKTENIETLAADLLLASNKYNLERLKAMCEDSMASSLCVENAADFLIFADINSASQLKSCATEYIKSNITHVLNTRGWKTMKANQAYLLTEFPSLDGNQIEINDQSTALNCRGLKPSAPPME